MRAVASAIAVTILAATGLASQQPAPGRSGRLQTARVRASIIAFDACLQERFNDVDEGFGFRRIVKAGDTPHRFKPENLREDAAVGDLERSRLRVVLYLTGRRVLQSDVPTALRAIIVKGPVEVTRGGGERDSVLAPQPLDLQADGRRALTAFSQANDYDFTAAGWSFVARPVRASAGSCLRCHSEDGTTSTFARHDRIPTLKIGDALGAVLYGYQTAR